MADGCEGVHRTEGSVPGQLHQANLDPDLEEEEDGDDGTVVKTK